jgi:hypothetical protein
MQKASTATIVPTIVTAAVRLPDEATAPVEDALFTACDRLYFSLRSPPVG